MHENIGEIASALRVERSGPVLRVTLERPTRANALDRDTIDRFLRALDDAAESGGLRALVIEGAGENFCGGFDLSQIETEDEGTLVLRILRVETLLQRLYHAPFVTLACAQGNAVGAGADLFAACTYRIASPNARFRMPGWQFGIALGTRRLCDRVGASAAVDILRASRGLGATEASARGLVTHVAERAEWASLVDELIAASGALSAQSLEQLHALCVPDHREADMAALVASALHPPGLKDRMVAYARAARAAKRQKS